MMGSWGSELPRMQMSGMRKWVERVWIRVSKMALVDHAFTVFSEYRGDDDLYVSVWLFAHVALLHFAIDVVAVGLVALL